MSLPLKSVAVFIDIDGTVADNRHRAHYVQNGQKDWDNFYRADLAAMDTMIPGAYDALKHMHQHGAELIFLTGRHEPLRQTTQEWLQRYFPFLSRDETALLMRPERDYRQAAIYKTEAVQRWASKERNQGRPRIFIDDDPKAREAFAAFGLVLSAPECWATLIP